METTQVFDPEYSDNDNDDDNLATDHQSNRIAAVRGKSRAKFSDYKSITTTIPPGLQAILDKFTESHENTTTIVDADLLVLQRDKIMDQHQLKKVIDYYGAVLKEGEIPIIHRPPFDDLSIWRNHISGTIVGVIGTEGIKQLENKPGWVRENNVRIYLNGSVIPEQASYLFETN